jgi:hypothetical protein
MRKYLYVPNALLFIFVRTQIVAPKCCKILHIARINVYLNSAIIPVVMHKYMELTAIVVVNVNHSIDA